VFQDLDQSHCAQQAVEKDYLPHPWLQQGTGPQMADADARKTHKGLANV